MENTENTVNPTETVDVTSGEEVAAEVGAEATESEEALGETELWRDEETSEEYVDKEAELNELRQVSGVEYGSLEEFTGYQRYLELKKSGILTAEEAFYAVNRGKNAEKDVALSDGRTFRADNSKDHLTSSRRRPSSGEVFTRADREELAKWGITATGSELERLWREAGK